MNKCCEYSSMLRGRFKRTRKFVLHLLLTDPGSGHSHHIELQYEFRLVSGAAHGAAAAPGQDPIFRHGGRPLAVSTR